MTRTNWLLRWFGGGVLAAALTSALVGAVLAVAVGVEDSMSWADSGESVVGGPSDVLWLGVAGALFGVMYGVLGGLAVALLSSAVLAVADGSGLATSAKVERRVVVGLTVFGAGVLSAFVGAFWSDPDWLLGLMVLLPPLASGLVARGVGGRLLPGRPRLVLPRHPASA